MAIGYQHPKVKVHVGDGFKFLDDYKNEFDVIITDSSDPEGPAESLFQKPYFELLFGALKEGGVITTQGCRFSLVQKLCFLLEVCWGTCCIYPLTPPNCGWSYQIPCSCLRDFILYHTVFYLDVVALNATKITNKNLFA